MISRFTDSNTNSTIYLFGGIKGLIRDGDELRNLLIKTEPTTILIGISPEELKGLSEFLKDPFELTLSDYEMIYGVILSSYGEVMTPAPIFTEALLYGEQHNVKMIALDMDEDKFGENFMNEIGTWSMIRHSVRKRRLMKKQFTGETAEEFVQQWNDNIEKIDGFRRIEQKRLDEMKHNFEQSMKSLVDQTAVVVIEYEKYMGMHQYMELLGLKPHNS
ncbi:MAG: hypothetical protein AAE977_06945 [Thermoplasmataceae archaeon]|jgi:hypothetical protein